MAEFLEVNGPGQLFVRQEARRRGLRAQHVVFGRSAPLTGQVFQIGNIMALNAILYRNSPAQLEADRFFQALVRMGRSGYRGIRKLQHAHRCGSSRYTGCPLQPHGH